MPKEIVSSNTLSNKEVRYLEIAKNLALSSAAGRYRHGAIVVKGGRILSTGINKVKNHPDVFEDKETILENSHIHAEVDALKKVGRVKGATIYIVRVNKTGKTGLSRPCDSCYERIVDAGITKIIYT